MKLHFASAGNKLAGMPLLLPVVDYEGGQTKRPHSSVDPTLSMSIMQSAVAPPSKSHRWRDERMRDH